MKKNTIISLAVVAVIACILASVLTPSCKREGVTLAATLLSAASAIMTMTLAVLLFNRYGVEQDVLKKQFDSVLALLKTLREMHFAMRATDEGGQAIFQITPLDPFSHSIFEMYYDRAIAFNEHAIEKMRPLDEHRYDIFLPVSIAEVLERIIPAFLQSLPDQNTKVARAIHFIPPDNNEDEPVYLSYNGAEMTFMEFLSRWSDVIDAIDAWLQEHATNAPTLNIRHLSKEDAP